MSRIDEWEDTHVVDNPLYALAVKDTGATPSNDERLIARALAACEQAWSAGVPLTAENLAGFDPALPTRLTRPLLVSSRFVQLLSARGIEPRTLDGLSPQQISAIDMYFLSDLPSGTPHSKRVRAAGVTLTQWRGWMRNPRFSERVARLSEQMLVDSQPLALSRIAEAVDKGERWAIELQLEMSGRHDRREKQADLGSILRAVFSVLDEEGLPGEVMAKIAKTISERMLGETPFVASRALHSVPIDAEIVEGDEQ